MRILLKALFISNDNINCVKDKDLLMTVFFETGCYMNFKDQSFSKWFI